MPHLLMLDLNRPRLDGLTVVRCVRWKKPSSPMLVATGRSLVEDGFRHDQAIFVQRNVSAGEDTAKEVQR